MNMRNLEQELLARAVIDGDMDNGSIMPVDCRYCK